jgi:GntR family transcriptional regulator, transcriptional repressor for pyruvate dehydrogenase complex
MPRRAARRALTARTTPPTASTPVEPEASAPRKADRVARDLLGRIVAGELSKGSVLPREEELAKHYGVNRSVVREAVKLLEVHRLLRPVRRRGTVVLDAMGSMSPEVLVAMLVPRPGHVDRRVLGSFLEVRAILDVEMTALAAERRTAADVRAMRALLASMADALHDSARYGKISLEVARLVARAAKNPLFEMLGAYNVRVATELDSAFAVTRPPSREHLEGLGFLVDLIEKKDVEGARRLVSGFHGWASPRILAAAALASGESLSVASRLSKESES